MEPVGAMSEAEWSSLSGTCPTEEADFMAQLFGSCPNEQPSSSNVGLPIFWTSHDQSSMNMGSGTSQVSMYNSSDEPNNSMYIYSSQGISNSDGSNILYPPPSHESYYPSNFRPNFLTNNTSMTMELSNRVEDKISSPSDQVAASNVIEADHAINFLNQEVSNDSMESGENMLETAHHGKSLQLGREYEMQVPEKSSQDREDSPSESSKKRSRLPVDIPKNKRSTKPKKNMKTADENGKAENVLHRQSSFSCCSEDESNFSYDLNGLTSSSNSKGKSRASRGSATDPQSLYARKRRERINERLRILQSLVPNGTKVDISTMLEEAVQYVKFLQLQIKLLSSDDLWMYSPIAYNGMDLGLDLKLGAPNS